MKKILILSGLSLLVALAVRAQDKVTEYNVRPAVAVRTPPVSYTHLRAHET